MELIYTDEMRQQDGLWEMQNEDLQVMDKLLRELYNQALSLGLDKKRYEAIFFTFEDESLVEIIVDGSEDDIYFFSNCFGFKLFLEYQLENK